MKWVGRIRESARPGVAARVPSWLAAVVAALLLLVLVLSGILLRMKSEELQAGNRDAALEALETRAAENTKDTKVLLELGFEYRKAGMLEDALRANRRVIEADPGNVAARYHMGSILLDLGREDEAEEMLWDALEIDPTHAMSAKALGEFYAERGQYRSLVVAVTPAAEASPALADLQYLLGLGREKTGDLTGAAQAYQSALESDPDLAAARDGLARLQGARQ